MLRLKDINDKEYKIVKELLCNVKTTETIKMIHYIVNVQC